MKFDDVKVGSTVQYRPTAEIGKVVGPNDAPPLVRVLFLGDREAKSCAAIDLRPYEVVEPPKEEPEPEQPKGPKYPHVHVRLSGMDGNAFFLIGRTQVALRDAGIAKEEIGEFVAEAESGDYDNVLRTIMRWVTTS